MHNEPLKIIHLFAPGKFGGAEKVIISGLKALLNKDINIELWLIKEIRATELCNDFIEYINDNKLKIKIFETTKPLDLNLIKSLEQSLKETKVDILHTHGIKGTFYGKLSKPDKSKLIITHHGNTSHTLKVRIYEYIEYKIMKKAHCTIAVSETMLNSLKESNIPNVILVENMLSFDPETRSVPSNKNLELVIIGRVSPEKGHIDLLKALKDLNLDFYLKIIGEGSEIPILKKYILENNLINKVEVIGFKNDIKPYLLNTDALVMPSHREGLPMILIEAICSGVPVIGSSVGALNYLVSDNGILFEPTDINAITESIIEFNNNKNKFLEIALNKTIIFQKRFHPNRWADETMKIYKNVFSQK
jgi:glycosyltransferase involved in cell wall biosynthesis